MLVVDNEWFLQGIQCTIATDSFPDASPKAGNHESSDSGEKDVSPLVEHKKSQIGKDLSQVSRSSLLTSSSEDMVKSASVDGLDSQSSIDGSSCQDSLKEHEDSGKEDIPLAKVCCEEYSFHL